MATLKELDLGTARRTPFQFERTTADGSKKTVSIELRVLTAHEIENTRLAAEEYIKRRDPDGAAPATHEFLRENAWVYETLALAIVDPEDRAPEVVAGTRRPRQWAGPIELRQTLHPLEVDLLWLAYCDWENQCSPKIYAMTAADQHAMLEALADEGESDPLVLLGTRTRRAFLRSMAAELLTARTVKSSPTSLESEPASESEGDEPPPPLSLDHAAAADVTP